MGNHRFVEGADIVSPPADPRVGAEVVPNSPVVKELGMDGPPETPQKPEAPVPPEQPEQPEEPEGQANALQGKV